MTESPSSNSRRHDVSTEIRLFVESDVPEYVDLKYASWMATYPNPEKGITVEIIAKHLNRRTRDAKIKALGKDLEDGKVSNRYILRDKGAMVGVVSYSLKNEHVGQVREIYLHPNFIVEKNPNIIEDEKPKKLGYGSQLMEFAIAELKKLGAKSIFVEVADYNARAIRFYAKFGFHFTNRIDKSVELDNGIKIEEIRMDLVL